jgi:hypothetical protein
MQAIPPSTPTPLEIPPSPEGPFEPAPVEFPSPDLPGEPGEPAPDFPPEA